MEETELMALKPSKASEIKLYIWAFLCAATILCIPVAIILLIVAWVRLASTKYRLTNQRLFKRTGLIARHEEEIELYRIQDVKMNQGIIQRLLKIGDITVVSTDETTPVLSINGVRNPVEVKETLRTAYREARKAEGVRHAEFIS